jgi:hypothetical protein
VTNSAGAAGAAAALVALDVKVRPVGPRRLYSLRAEPFRELDTWVSRYRNLWGARMDRFAAELERRKKARSSRRKEKSS